MDAAMAARWNAAVGPDDLVWHLGDLTGSRDRARVEALLASLHGRKRLVAGNNDGAAVREASGWEMVADYAETEVDGIGLVLCHYPFRTWNGMGRGRLDLHGHSHGRLKPAPRQHDVGVDVRGFRPVTLAEILGARRRPSAVIPGLAKREPGTHKR